MGKKLFSVFLCLTLVLTFALAPVGALAAVKTVNILQAEDDYIRVRSAPTSAEGEVLATLREGTKMFYLGRSGSWAYICTETGLCGYVYSGFLSYYGAVRLSNVYYVQSSSLKVYSSASTSARRIATLPKGYFVLLYEANGNWGFIRSLSGGGGFVLLSGLRRAA